MRADRLRAGQFGDGGLGAIVAALVHVARFRLRHIGFLSFSAFLGAAFSDEDGEGE